MYEIYDQSGNSFYFTPVGRDTTNTRIVNDNPMTMVQDSMLMDQVSTKREISQMFSCKTGTGQPYATFLLAIAALESLTPNSRTSSSFGWTLIGGDWNGSAFSINNAYPSAGNLLVTMVRYSLRPGENYTNGEITGTISMQKGTIY
jgi:hypothetical protein